jgi:hypothetical protein
MGFLAGCCPPPGVVGVVTAGGEGGLELEELCGDAMAGTCCDGLITTLALDL